MSVKPLSDADSAALASIAGRLSDPSLGLPDAVFEFALAITPMINVDLLVLEPPGRVLLAWRVDPWGQGWHIPGGIIRVHETFERRIAETARLELGVDVRPASAPQAVTPFFGERGHFISLLYPCRVADGRLNARLTEPGATPRHEDLRWFDAPPREPYPIQRDYIADAFRRAPDYLALLGDDRAG